MRYCAASRPMSAAELRMNTRFLSRFPSGSEGMSITTVGRSESARSAAVASVSGIETRKAAASDSISARSASGENSAFVRNICTSYGASSPYVSVR